MFILSVGYGSWAGNDPGPVAVMVRPWLAGPIRARPRRTQEGLPLVQWATFMPTWWEHPLGGGAGMGCGLGCGPAPPGMSGRLV